MKKQGFKWILASALLLTFVLMVILFSVTSVFHKNDAHHHDALTPLTLKGQYSSDGVNWTDIDSFNDFENNHYEKVIFKGTLSKEIPENQYLVLSLSDVWAELKVDGKVVMTNRNGGISPGYSYHYINASDVSGKALIELTLENPYYKFHSMAPIEDTIGKIGYGCKDIMYHQLLSQNTLSVVLCLAVCFLGLFAFTLAGMLWKNARARNFAFALLAVSCGLTALTDSIYQFLPLWIQSPVLCMTIDEATHILLPMVLFFYVTVNTSNNTFKTVMSCATVFSTLMAACGFLLQLFSVSDLITTKYYIQPVFGAELFISAVVLFCEAFRFKNKNAVYIFVSMTPLLLSVIADYANSVFAFAQGRIFVRLGLFVTVVINLFLLLTEARLHAKESLKYEKMQYEMLQMQISIMTSQIQPHFLYNSLTSIAQLCEKNPAKAKTATIDFSDYLRKNMQTLKEKSPVSFESELEHLKTYVSLEKMRFGEELNVVYNITETNFSIPSLTIQPLVENAVKHGVGMKEDGGTVWVSAYDSDKFFIVEVSDDGVGFDTNKVYDDGKSHIGMMNVRNRLKNMCGGTLEITSEINKGTKAVIKIPKEQN